MSLRDTLTNEKLNDQYKNSFALVNHAIVVAKRRIALGDGMKSDLATDILENIANGKEVIPNDKMDNLGEEDSLELEEVV